MAREILYLVQAYAAGRGKALKPDAAVQCKSAEQAVRSAQRLEPIRLGVVAYTITVDEELGEYDETPKVLYQAGRVPPPFGEG